MTDENTVSLLLKLNHLEEFRLWRDQVAKPVIDQLEARLANPMELDEANLKASVMHLNFVRSLFYRLFDELAVQKELEKQQKQEN